MGKKYRPPDIARAVGYLIKASGMTYESMGMITDLDPTCIKRHLRDDQGIRWDTMCRYASAFGIPVSALVALAECIDEHHRERTANAV